MVAEETGVRGETYLTSAEEEHVGALRHFGEFVVRNRNEIIAGDFQYGGVEFFREKVFLSERPDFRQGVGISIGYLLVMLHDSEFPGEFFVDHWVDGRDAAFLFGRQVLHIHDFVPPPTHTNTLYWVAFRPRSERGSVVDDGVPVVRNEQFPSGGHRLAFRDDGETKVLRTALLFLLRVLDPYFDVVHEVVADDGTLAKIVVETLFEDTFRQIPIRTEADAGGVLVTETLTSVASDGKIETAGVGKRGLGVPQFGTQVLEKASYVSVSFFLSAHLKVDCVCDKIDR